MALDITLARIEDTATEYCLMADEWPELKQVFTAYVKDKNIEDLDDTNETSVYYYSELAHQRKGVTEAFYKNVPADACLVTKHEVANLQQYMDEEHEDTFSKEFISGFDEGRMFVLISW
mgnify:CR=1 FL=1